MARNKKTWLIGSGLVTLAFIAAFLSLRIEDKINTNKAPDYSYQMTGGEVMSVMGNVVTIKGIVVSSKDGSTRKEEKEVKIKIADSTQLSKLVTYSDKPIKEGEVFTPQRKNVVGGISDFDASTKIIRLTTQEDLFASSEATAKTIYYQKYEF